MAVGEAACVSVHGGNRLGSNSLLDLVVFGRAAGLRCAATVEKGQKHKKIAADSEEKALARLDKFRNAKGSLPTAKVRLDMQKTMQAPAAVFRTQKLMDEGIEHPNKVIDSFEDVAVSDRSMIDRKSTRLHSSH